MGATGTVFLEKAEECLRGAEREFGDGCYNNCANRCYYACFQAAVYALLQAGDLPAGDRAIFGHDVVQARFVGQLINRRKRLTAALLELQGLIHARYPTATFRRFRGDDPAGMYLQAAVAVEDTDEVVDVIIDRLLAMQIDEGLSVYVIPVRAA